MLPEFVVTGSWSKTNLAIAYLDRMRGDVADNQEKAIACLQAALTVFTPVATPQLWAQAQHNLGKVYADRVRGERASNRQQAVASFKQALTVFTRDAAPLDHLRTSRLLGRVLMESGEWTLVAPIHASAREAFLLLFGQGVSEIEARALIADAGPLFAESAFAALQRGETEKAFELADEGRARLLAVALKLQAIDLPTDQRRRLDDLREAIRSSQAAADAAPGTERVAAIDKVIDLRRELFALVDRGGKDSGTDSSALAKARRVAATGATVVMPVVTAFGGKLLIVGPTKAGKELTVVDVPALSTKSLSELLVGPTDAPNTGWIGAYFVNYLEGADAERRWPEWIAGIDRIGPELWHLFGGRLDAALKERGVKGHTRLAWLPSGWLGILPLGLAQDPSSKRRFTDDYTIVYAPSLEALTAGDDLVAGSRRASLAAVVNPTGDLPGTEKEIAFVASHFTSADRAVLEGAAATPDSVLAGLRGKTYWHFATHGGFSWTDARQSALLMHDAVPLSVGRLLEAEGLGRPRLVVLSACETGLYDITNSPRRWCARHAVAGVGRGHRIADGQILRSSPGGRPRSAYGFEPGTGVATRGNGRGYQRVRQCRCGGRKTARRPARVHSSRSQVSVGDTCTPRLPGTGDRKQSKQLRADRAALGPTSLRSSLLLGGLHIHWPIESAGWHLGPDAIR